MSNIFQTISNILFCEHFEHGSYASKIVILVRNKKMYMYNFFSFSIHIYIQSLCLFHITDIWNVYYIYAQFYIYIIISVSMVQPQFFIIGISRIAITLAFYRAKLWQPWQTPSTSRFSPYRRRNFQADFHNQRLGILENFSTDCLAYCLC